MGMPKSWVWPGLTLVSHEGSYSVVDDLSSRGSLCEPRHSENILRSFDSQATGSVCVVVGYNMFLLARLIACVAVSVPMGQV